MEGLAKIILDIVFLMRELVAIWVTPGHTLTSQGETLVSHIGSAMTSLPIMLKDPITILQRAILNPDIVFLNRELLATWVTPGLTLTSQGGTLVSYIASAINSLSVIVSDLIRMLLYSF
jgi:hypothetical protein